MSEAFHLFGQGNKSISVGEFAQWVLPELQRAIDPRAAMTHHAVKTNGFRRLMSRYFIAEPEPAAALLAAAPAFPRDC
jgi:hypothetical protein